MKKIFGLLLLFGAWQAVGVMEAAEEDVFAKLLKKYKEIGKGVETELLVIKNQMPKDKELSEDEEGKIKNLDDDIPERCPVCNLKKKHILRHIKTSESCFQKVDRKTFDKKAQDKYLRIKQEIREESNKKKWIINENM